MIKYILYVYKWLFVCALVNQTGFYFTHRLCHESEWMFKNVHKQHHRYTGSIGFAAEYAHPIEQVLSNQGPTILGALLQGVPTPVWWTFLAWRLWNTYEGHSGYAFKGTFLDEIGLLHAEEARYHDYHHSRNKDNYGSGQYLFDYWLGTSDYYYGVDEKTLQKKNDTTTTTSD